ncbi:MAG: sulfatase-like hydrolase/transferase [Chloroflexota bacterium]
MKSQTRPNILWICSDQQRFDTLGCYGNTYVHTPHIDRLAENGLLFEHCYSQSPVCTPSRASFLTGRYPRTTRCRANGQSIPEDEVLVTRLLSEAGYVCGLSGKLHLSVCNPSVTPGTERRINDGYDEFHWSHHPPPQWPTSDYAHWLREKGVEYSTPSYNGSKYVEAGMPAEHHQTTWCAQKAINFIEAHADYDHPWLFSVNMFDPHHAFDPPVVYLERYLDQLEDIPLPNYVQDELDNKPAYQKRDHHGAYDNPNLYPFSQMTDEDHRLVRAAYWAMCDLIDEQVGRMIAALEATNQLDNTIIIFMSDHGEMLGDHGIYLKGPYFYDPAVRVPMIVSYPKAIRSGERSSALIELSDIAPTLLEAAGLPEYAGMQAQSLWPLLTGDSTPDHHRDTVYCEYYDAWTHDAASATMLRNEQFKFVACHQLSTGELYDLKTDPTETQNLWDDAAYASTKLDLFQQLSDRMAQTVDPLPPREAKW